MRFIHHPALILFYLFTVQFFNPVTGQEEALENREDNLKCFTCHGQSIYEYYNDWTGRNVKKMMNPLYVIDSTAFYNGTHHMFRCIDCHAADYEIFPHDNQLRFEPQYTCMDCHGYDEDYAEYNFELIEQEFLKSVHSTDSIGDFSCWKCHDPHSFRLTVRTNESIRNVVTYDNNVCFSCHTDKNKFQLLGADRKTNLIEKHDWLPNQELHFNKVRCIECHNQVHDSLIVAHQTLPASGAVRKCAECHSQNTLLLSTLYKYEVIQNRTEEGFLNAIILNESYVIGASRSRLLNLTSIIIFGLTILGIAVHAFLRIKKRKSS